MERPVGVKVIAVASFWLGILLFPGSRYGIMGMIDMDAPRPNERARIPTEPGFGPVSLGGFLPQPPYFRGA